jgi:tetratricopeptide (TPR) repeat protein
MEGNGLETVFKNVDKLMGKGKYLDAIKMLREIKVKEDSEENADVLSKLSQAYYGLEGVKTNNAIKYLIDSLNIRKNLDQPEILALEMMNLAYLQDETGDGKTATSTLQEALEVATEIGDPNLTLSLKCAMADMLSEDKTKEEESLQMYQSIMKEAEKIGDWENYFEACVARIKIFRDRDDIFKANSEAEENLKKAESILSSIKTKKDKEAFKDVISYLYDVSIDLAMENEDIPRAMELAKKFKGEE